MATFKIKKYYLKKHHKGFVKIMATVFKYRFGFIVDIMEEELDSDLKRRFENDSGFYYIQCPKTKKEAKTILEYLSKKVA